MLGSAHEIGCVDPTIRVNAKSECRKLWRDCDGDVGCSCALRGLAACCYVRFTVSGQAYASCEGLCDTNRLTAPAPFILQDSDVTDLILELPGLQAPE